MRVQFSRSIDIDVVCRFKPFLICTPSKKFHFHFATDWCDGGTVIARGQLGFL